MPDNDTKIIVAENLRAAADLLTATLDLPSLPYITTSASGKVDLNWFLNGRGDLTEQKATARAIIAAIGGKWDKGTGDWSGPLATFTQRIGGLVLSVQVQREAVCERVVTGTKTVTIPAKPAEPERTEVVETVEWRCEPVLSEAVAR